MRFESAIFQWDEGERRLLQTPARQRAVLQRVIDRAVEELRRRLGGPFTVAELVELYDGGADWCLELALHMVPEDPAAWDAKTIADAACRRYVREASDFAGGQRLGA